MNPCERCQVLPEPLPAEGTLYFSPPEPSTQAKLLLALRKLGLDHQPDEDGIHTARMTVDQLRVWCRDIQGQLNSIEAHDTRCVFLDIGRPLTVRDAVRMQTLTQLIAEANSEVLRDLLSRERLTCFFQPIVHAADTTQVYAFECLLRGLDDDNNPMSPGPLFKLASDADMLFQLDRAARLQIIKNVSHRDIKANIFINFVPTSVYNPEFCLRTTVKAADEAGLSRDQIVFEVTESEKITDLKHLQNILTYYRENGFRVALDDLGSGYSSLNLIHHLRPDFLKMDMELVQGVDQDGFKASVSKSLLNLAQELEIPVIAEGIERVEEYEWLRENGATYMQGYLFARPAADPPVPVAPPSRRG